MPMHTIYNVFQVEGMTCGQCAASITEELSELDHVTDVAVNLVTGTVTVASASELNRRHVAAALAHSGHRLADWPDPGVPRASSGPRVPRCRGEVSASERGR